MTVSSAPRKKTRPRLGIWRALPVVWAMCLIRSAAPSPALAPAENGTPPSAPRVAAIRVFPLVPVDPIALQGHGPLEPGQPRAPEKAAEHARALRDRVRDLIGGNPSVVTFQDDMSSSSIAVGFIIEPVSAPPQLGKMWLRGTGPIDFLNRADLSRRVRDEEGLAFDKGTSVTAARLLEVARFAEAYYRDKGFLEARVRLAETGLTEDARTVNVAYEIVRGPRYMLDNAQVGGNRKVPGPSLADIVERFVGRRFSGANWREMRRRIEELCMKQGYMAPRIESDIAANTDNHTVSMQVRVDEGSTSTLGAVRVIHHPLDDERSGGWFGRFRSWTSPPLRDDVVARQVRARPGDALDFQSIDEPRRSLEAIGCLEDVEVTTEATSNTQVRDVVVEVTDKRSGAVVATGGWASWPGAFGMLQLSEMNVGGVGDRLTFQTSASEEWLSFDVSYFDRNWIFGERYLGAERAPSLKHTLYCRESWYREYTERNTGVAWELTTRRLNPRSLWRDAWRLRFEDVALDPRSDPDHYEEDFDDYFAATVGYGLSRDTRDRGDLSREGTYLGASLEMGHADGLLLRSVARFEVYQTFLKRMTWVTKGELGLMPFGADNVGIGERFQGGGVHDLRGFEVRGVGPVDSREENLHIGGATKTLLSNELRYAITEDIIPLVFCDVGSLDENPFSFDTWNVSVGVGFRYIVPGIDKEVFAFYSHPLADRDTDEGDALQFGMRFALP